MTRRTRIVLPLIVSACLLMPSLALAEETLPPTVVDTLPRVERPEPADNNPAPDSRPSAPRPDAVSQPDLGGEPQEILEPQATGAGAREDAARQAAAEAEAKAVAQAAAKTAVDEARVGYERALAQHRISKFQVKRLLDRSHRAGATAEQLRADLGNLARMAYTAGNSDLNVIAALFDSESPEDFLASAGAAACIADHKQAQQADLVTNELKAAALAARARRVSDRTGKKLLAAKTELNRTLALADAVNLAITPPKRVPPVDLATKSDWVFPTATGKIDSDPGMRMHPILGYKRCHTGADISAPTGTAIYAVDDGVVLSAGVNGGYGNFTLIAHGGGLTSAYAHQNVLLVKPGDRVTRGQHIGEVGSTGLSTGPHLHFEASHHQVPYNPRGWLEDAPLLRVPAC